ncbi:MAG TPA: Hpt domain-containing protein, partial [Chloroflexota bacterium]|nr:Hpt domain-containing protein [Chloroflexota bacterium]
MSALDPAQHLSNTLAPVRAAFAAAQAAPAIAADAHADEDEQQDIATPRAKAAAALETRLKARREWYRKQGQLHGEELCKTLIDMCAWHEHPQLRDRMLVLQDRGLALLEAVPDGQPSMADVGDLQDDYQRIKPREDDAAAIAAALGMSLEEARAFGLIGTLGAIGLDEDAPAPMTASATGAAEEEEDLETLFRREALVLVSRTLPQALQRFWSAQRSIDAMLDLRRAFHTLKGDARVTAQSTTPDVAAELEGLAVLSEAAEDIIDYLLGDDYDSAKPAPALPAGAFSLLNETASALARRLERRAPLQHETDLLHRLEMMHRKASVLSGAPSVEARPAVPVPKRVPVPRPAPLRPPVHALLPTFLEEAGRLMPDLHRALGTLSENPADEGALVRARVKLHTLKGGAALVGEDAQEIQAIAHSAEDLLELIEDFQLRGEMSVVPQAVLEGVQDAEDALQALLDILRPQGQSGRIAASSRLLQITPRELIARLNAIAERVRAGDVGKPGGSAAPATTEPAIERALRGTGSLSPLRGTRALPPSRGTASLSPFLGTGSLSPLLDRPSPLLQRADLTPFIETRAGDIPTPAAENALEPVAVTASYHLQTVAFQDILEHAEQSAVHDATAVFNWARMIENRAGTSGAPFTLYTCVQYLSSFEQERARYLSLV